MQGGAQEDESVRARGVQQESRLRSILCTFTFSFSVLVFSFWCLMLPPHSGFPHCVFNEQPMAHAFVLSLMWSVQNETAGE